MTTEVKNLYDKKGKIHAQMQDVARKLKEGVALSTEEETQFDAWDKEYEKCGADIKRLERAEQLDVEAKVAKLEGEAGDGGAREKNIYSYAQKGRIMKKAQTSGLDKLSKEERNIFESIADESRAFENMIRYGEQNLNEEELAIVQNLKASYISQEKQAGERAQTVTTTGGGYVIPPGFNPDIYKSLKLVSPFFEELKLGPTDETRKLFAFMETAGGNDIPWPTIDDTSNSGELLAINTDAFANTTDLTFGQIVMKAYKYSPKPMKVPYELLQDAGIDLPGLIAEMLGTREGRIVNTHLTTGDNSNKPQGITVGAAAGKVSASATAITFPEVLDLVHSVDPAYRKSPSARFMFHDNILLYLKKLTIGSSSNDSRPVWQPGFATGAPDTIDGFQYLINQDMASSVATGNITMLFGDMKGYAVRQAGPFRLKFLQERFADADQVAWVLFGRFDGRTLNTNAIKKLTQA